MKKIIWIVFLIVTLGGCKIYEQSLETACTPLAKDNAPYSKAEQLIPLMNEAVKSGIPGLAAAVFSEEGWWQYSTGLAKIEDQTPMQPCHLHYLQSIAKTYQAAAIMKLVEEGKIQLDSPITDYLPTAHHQYIDRADEITVRMLLNHTSGIPEYNSDPNYISILLQKPDKYFTAEEYLEVIKGKSLVFEPGSQYRYCNMNYELLSLLADAVTGDHAHHITKVILEPLRLQNTFYRDQPGYLTYPALYNGYWDRHANGIVENVSRMQRTNVASMIGDDGIVSTPKDAVLFLKGLMEGHIISKESIELMKTGFVNEEGKVDYGLGLDLGMIADKLGFGHSGGGLAAGCQLYYLPHNNTYFFIGVNFGTVTEGPIQTAIEPIIEKIHEVLVSE